MLLMGDEVRHTQGGNNNAYCQDNEISWLDWTRLEKHADVHRFLKLLIARRLFRDVEHERQRVSLTTLLREANKAWHGVRLDKPDWSEHSHCLALGGQLEKQSLYFHFILNAYWEPLEFELPELENTQWRRWIDTYLDPPNDIVPWEESPPVQNNTYPVGDRSVVMLFTTTPPSGLT